MSGFPTILNSLVKVAAREAVGEDNLLFGEIEVSVFISVHDDKKSRYIGYHDGDIVVLFDVEGGEQSPLVVDRVSIDTSTLDSIKDRIAQFLPEEASPEEVEKVAIQFFEASRDRGKDTKASLLK